jgi:hypothetical protein
LDASKYEDVLLNEVGVQEVPTHGVSAPLVTASPVADGMIGPGEYPNSCYYTFAENVNPGQSWPTLDNLNDGDADLNMTMHLAHTDQFLFLGFTVVDDFLDFDEGSLAFNNDSVELFINPDLDQDGAYGPGRLQIIGDAAGEGDPEFNNRYSAGGPQPVTTNDPPPVEGEWYSAGITNNTGYVVEFQIPLGTLDREGGEGDEVVPAKTGDMIPFNVALDDNDEGENLAGQNGHHILWQVEGANSPFGGGEPIWVVPLELSQPVAANPGDLDNDGDVDDNDIDAEATAVRTAQTDTRFDLNNDGSVSAADHTHLVENIKNTYIGDANLDGVFGSADFVQVFQRGEYEDTAADNSGWADGDWNGDADFDSGDFVAAFQAGGYEKGPRAAVSGVPEPAAAILALVGWLSVIHFHRRR